MTKVTCKKCKKDHDYTGENKVNWTCPDCRTLNKLPAIALAVIVSLALLAMGPIHAETITFQFDDTYLNSTFTNKTENMTQADGSVTQWVNIALGFNYPNQTIHDANKYPVKADPEGNVFELLLHDAARIFSPIVKFFTPEIEPEVEDLAEEEKTRKLTKPEQEALNRLKDECDYEGGQGKAFAFQGVYEIFLDHPIEWYAQIENKDERNKKTEECKGLGEVQHIANTTIGSRVIDESDTFIFTPTDQSQKNDFDFSVDGAKWREQAEKAEVYAKNQSHFGALFDEPHQSSEVVATNQTSKSAEEKAHEKHVAIQETRTTAQITKCTEYWDVAREGKAPLNKWTEELKTGLCDGFVFETIDGKEVPVMIQEILADKIQRGDKP